MSFLAPKSAILALKSAILALKSSISDKGLHTKAATAVAVQMHRLQQCAAHLAGKNAYICCATMPQHPFVASLLHFTAFASDGVSVPRNHAGGSQAQTGVKGKCKGRRNPSHPCRQPLPVFYANLPSPLYPTPKRLVAQTISPVLYARRCLVAQNI